VDFDDICITNTNRQLHTLTGQIGQKKATVMADRLRKINPQGNYLSIEKFYSAETSQEILDSRPTLVIDCIDNLKAKSHLIATCRDQKIPILVAGGGGSRKDPTKLAVLDLAETHTDPFLAQLRKDLRTRHGFDQGPFGIKAVFSTEAPIAPESLSYDKESGFRCVCPQGQNNFHSCERRNIIHGTSSFVVGTIGLWLASLAIETLNSVAPQETAGNDRFDCQ
jgi:tRNA A37 threonylcarbamoyladenosine dehydratase